MKLSLRVLLSLGGALLILGLVFWMAGGRGDEERRGSEADLLTGEEAKDGGTSSGTPAGKATQGGAALAAFRDWVSDFREASSNVTSARRGGLIAQGVVLAEARRAAMGALMRSDPEAAMRQALRWDEWLALPEDVRVLVEEPFSEVAAAVEVNVVCQVGEQFEGAGLSGFGGPEDWVETAFQSGTNATTYLYGQREGMLTKEDAPVQGIRLDGEAVLREGIFQRLDEAELAAVTAAALFETANPVAGRGFLTGEPLGAEAVVGLLGGKLFYFAGEEALRRVEGAARAWENEPGPGVGPQLIFAMLESGDGVLGGGGFDLVLAEEAAVAATTVWTGTRRDMYVILVDFPDVTGANKDPMELENELDTAVSQQVWEMSYGRSYIDSVVNATTFRMPKLSTYYNGTTDEAGNLLVDENGDPAPVGKKNSELHNAAVAATGVDLSSYETWCVYFKSIGMGYGGLASVGGKKMWIQGNNPGNKVVVHELGHNYGTGHASYWDVGGSTDPIDPAGTLVEYGDFMDIMGGGGLPNGHFTVRNKERVNWLLSDQWQHVSGSGTYRVHRSDAKETDLSLLQAVRVNKTGGDYYWIGYRQLWRGRDRFDRGAYVCWKQSANKSILLDMSPGDADGKQNAGLVLGQTFSDAAAQVHITPVELGGYAPNEWIDVTVNIGAFAGNVAPTGTMSGPMTVNARENVVFSANATDGDGDELAYYWTFEDNIVVGNEAEIAYAWTAGGSYTVTCVVSDMKGGTLTLSQAVTVNDPLNQWTQRVSGVTTHLKDIAVNSAGTMVMAAGDDGWTTRSTDGTNWTASRAPDGDGNSNFKGVCWDEENGLWIAVGEDNEGSGALGWIHTSPDGAAWTERYFSGPGLRKVACNGAGVSVAVGLDGRILRSINGTAWSVVSSGTTSKLEGVAYGDGVFLAGGDDGGSVQPVFLSSADGLSWVEKPDAVPGLGNGWNLAHLRYVEDRFLASGTSKWRVRHSKDGGGLFEERMYQDNYDMAGLTQGVGIWFAAGINRSSSNADTNLVSLDGAHYVPLAPIMSQPNRTAAVFFNSTFITSGDNGNLWQSDPVSAVTGGWGAWQYQHRDELGAKRERWHDMDMDGDDNFTEYSLGNGPGDASSRQVVSSRVDENGYLEITIERNGIAGDVIYEVLRSTDLESWSELDLVVVSDTAAALVVRSAMLASEVGREFLRLRLTEN